MADKNFRALGNFLGGGNHPNEIVAEAQGENLGANTQAAIAKAKQTLDENAARAQYHDQARAYIKDPAEADFVSGAQLSGFNPEQGMQAHLGAQKFSNLGKVADTTLPENTRAGALLAADPASHGPINTSGAGEVTTDAFNPEAGAKLTDAGRLLMPAKVEAVRAKAALDRDIVANTEHYHHTPMGGGPISPEDQATLTRLINAGVVDPSHITRYNASPIAIRAAGGALDSGTYNPGLHAAATLAKSEADYGAGGKDFQRIRAGNAVSSHIKMLQGLADAQDANDLPAAQKLFTALTGQAGSDFPTMNKLGSDFVGRELDGFLSAGNPTLQGHTEAAGHFNQNEIGAQQLRSNVMFGKKLMGGQYGALKQGYASATGRTPQDVKNFANRFMGGNRDILDEFEREHGEVVPGMPGSAAAAPGAPLPAAAPAAGASAPAGAPPPGWVLHQDAAGNKAYVSPDGKQFQEVK